jgi:hypothetical protein
VGALDDWAAKACTDDFVLNEFRRIHLEASIVSAGKLVTEVKACTRLLSQISFAGRSMDCVFPLSR